MSKVTRPRVTDTVAPVDPQDMRGAMGRLLTGVVIVTSMTPDGPVGLTINSFTSVTLDPATVLICLNNRSRGYEAIMDSGLYAINILSGSQDWLAGRFATPGLSQEERFENVATRIERTGSPVITGASAWMDCRVVDVQQVGTHGLFFGSVLAAGEDNIDEAPLAYYQRAMYALPQPAMA